MNRNITGDVKSASRYHYVKSGTLVRSLSTKTSNSCVLYFMDCLKFDAFRETKFSCGKG